MAAIISFFIVLSATAFAEQVGMANPSAVYCEELGYKYKIEKTGVCVIEENAIEYDAWDFFEGKIGQQYSYCSKHGYDIETVKDGKNQYSREYSVCVIKKSSGPSIQSIKERKPVTELMDLNKNSIKKSVKIEGIENPISEPIYEDYGISSQPYFDWRNVNNSNWMTPVKDQGGCGSCWAFASVGVIESKIKITKSNSSFDKDLSEQDLVSCFAVDGCNGIDDSQFPSLLSHIQSNGITDELCFPYNATNEPCSDKCPTWKSRLWYIDGYGSISNVSKTKDYLIERGPLIALIGMSGYFDGNGIYRCVGTPSLNHAIVIVGYNDTGEYWIAKNSWSSGWNGNGYFNVGYNECNIIPSYYIGLPNAVNATETNYCSVASKSSNYEIIINVSLNGNERNSGKSNYSDFTNTTLTNLTLGSVYTLYVTGNATAQASPNEFVKAWIDFNNDKSFSNDEAIDLGNFTFVGKHTFNKSFTVPNNANVGETRMRVYLKWKSAPTPCENASYGEVEDYKIRLITNITPIIPLEINISSPSNGTVLTKDSTWFNLTTNRNSACNYVETRCQTTDGFENGVYSSWIKTCDLGGSLIQTTDYAYNGSYSGKLYSSYYSKLGQDDKNLDLSVWILLTSIGSDKNYLNLMNSTSIFSCSSCHTGAFLFGWTTPNLWYYDGSSWIDSGQKLISQKWYNARIAINATGYISEYNVSNSTWYFYTKILNYPNTLKNTYVGFLSKESSYPLYIDDVVVKHTLNNDGICVNSPSISMSTIDGIHHSAFVTSLTNTAANEWYQLGANCTDYTVSNISYVIFFVNITTIPPEISIIRPVNNSLITTNSTVLEVSINQNGTCRYSLDSSSYSDPWESLNFSKLIVNLSEGKHEISVKCNFSGNEINKSVFFTVDTLSPGIWTSVKNDTYNCFGDPLCENELYYMIFNVFILKHDGSEWEEGKWIKHSLDGAGNVTDCTNCTGITSDLGWLPLGTHNVTIYVSDYVENENSTNIVFTIVNLSTLVNNWAINLSIDLDSSQKGIWKFGMSDNATDLFDNGIDDTSPPASPEGFDTYFTENEPTPKDRLSIDIKKMSDEKNWTLVVTAPKQQVVSVKWNSTIDANLTLKIGEIDSGTGNYIGEILNMKYYDSLTFSGDASSPVTKFYKITASKSSYKVETLNLSAGWNLISIPLVLQNNSIQNVFDNKVQSVWAYDNGVWSVWVPCIGGTLTSINPKIGYWVATNENKLIVVEGTENTNHTIPLYNGWSLIGPTKIIPLPLSNPHIIGSIWGWTGSNYFSVDSLLEPKKAYWIAASQNTTID